MEIQVTSTDSNKENVAGPIVILDDSPMSVTITGKRMLDQEQVTDTKKIKIINTQTDPASQRANQFITKSQESVEELIVDTNIKITNDKTHSSLDISLVNNEMSISMQIEPDNNSTAPQTSDEFKVPQPVQLQEKCTICGKSCFGSQILSEMGYNIDLPDSCKSRVANSNHDCKKISFYGREGRWVVGGVGSNCLLCSSDFYNHFSTCRHISESHGLSSITFSHLIEKNKYHCKICGTYYSKDRFLGHVENHKTKKHAIVVYTNDDDFQRAPKVVRSADDTIFVEDDSVLEGDSTNDFLLTGLDSYRDSECVEQPKGAETGRVTEKPAVESHEVVKSINSAIEPSVPIPVETITGLCSICKKDCLGSRMLEKAGYQVNAPENLNLIKKHSHKPNFSCKNLHFCYDQEEKKWNIAGALHYCFLCKKEFRSKEQIYKHFDNVHDIPVIGFPLLIEDIKFFCKLCGVYHTKHGLGRHIDGHLRNNHAAIVVKEGNVVLIDVAPEGAKRFGSCSICGTCCIGDKLLEAKNISLSQTEVASVRSAGVSCTHLAFTKRDSEWIVGGIGKHCLICSKEDTGGTARPINQSHSRAITFSHISEPMYMFCSICQVSVAKNSFLKHVAGTHKSKVRFTVNDEAILIQSSSTTLSSQELDDFMVKNLSPLPFEPPQKRQGCLLVPTVNETPIPHLGVQKTLPEAPKNQPPLKLKLRFRKPSDLKTVDDVDLDTFKGMFLSGADLEGACKLCPRVFPSRLNIQSHYKNSHKMNTEVLSCIREKLDSLNEPRKQCSFCKWSFVDLKAHITKYHMFKKSVTRQSVVQFAKDLSCGTCGESYESAVQLRDHLEKVHKVEEVQRDQIFSVTNDIPEIIPCSDDEIKTIDCKICGYAADNLSQHMEKYHMLKTTTPESFFKRFKSPKDFDTVCKFCPRAKAFISHESLLKHFKDVHRIPAKITKDIKKKIGMSDTNMQKCTLCPRKDVGRFFDLEQHFSEFHLLKPKTAFSDLFNSDLECKSCILLFVSEEDYHEHLINDHHLDPNIIKSSQSSKKKNPIPTKKVVMKTSTNPADCHRHLIREVDVSKLAQSVPMVKTDVNGVVSLDAPPVEQQSNPVVTFSTLSWPVDTPTNTTNPLNVVGGIDQNIPSNLMMIPTNVPLQTNLSQNNVYRAPAEVDLKVSVERKVSSLPQDLLKFREFIELDSSSEDEDQVDRDSIVTVSDVESDIAMDLEPSLPQEKDYFIVRTNLGLAKFPRKRANKQPKA